MKYLSVTAYAKQVSRDPSRIRRLCAEGRITGAFKPLGSQDWVIPVGAEIQRTEKQTAKVLHWLSTYEKAAIKRL